MRSPIHHFLSRLQCLWWYTLVPLMMVLFGRLWSVGGGEEGVIFGWKDIWQRWNVGLYICICIYIYDIWSIGWADPNDLMEKNFDHVQAPESRKMSNSVTSLCAKNIWKCFCETLSLFNKYLSSLFLYYRTVVWYGEFRNYMNLSI